MNILFLCAGNTCNSILAQATFNSLAPAGLNAMSAGSKPTGDIHPGTIAILKRKGISIDDYNSKSWNNLPVVPDIVITLCQISDAEIYPGYLINVIRAHWGVDDLAKVKGSEEEIEAAFERAYSVLRMRIEAFLKLKITEIQNHAFLQSTLNNIGLLQ